MKELPKAAERAVMGPKYWLFARALANHYHVVPANRQLLGNLTHNVPVEKTYPSFQNTDLSPGRQSPTQQIQGIHYSWIAMAIQEWHPTLQRITAASLPCEGHKVLRLLKQVPSKSSPTYLAKRFCVQYLCQQLIPQHLLPLCYLADSPLLPLSSCSKTQLVHIIDCLGLYDLMIQLRLLVDQKLLKRIIGTLTALQQNFLRLHAKNKKGGVSPIKTERWDMAPPALQRQIHRCGIQRLAQSLVSQPSDLIWHISRRLDTGRGTMLQHLIASANTASHSSLPVGQVLDAYHFVKEYHSE